MQTILIIDDDQDVRDTLAAIVESGGYSAVAVDSGLSGLDLLDQLHPDLILTDIIMPGIDGIEYILQIQAADPKVPIIAMSGESMLGNGFYLRLAKNLGAAAVLSKPFKPAELLETIDRCLNPTA